MPEPTTAPEPTTHDTAAEEAEYRGPATLHADDTEITTRVQLRGNFQPIDGRFHWYGRLDAAEEVDGFAATHRKNVLLRTSEGEATGTLSDRDTWGRFRIEGLGRPPFRLDESPITDTD